MSRQRIGQVQYREDGRVYIPRHIQKLLDLEPCEYLRVFSGKDKSEIILKKKNRD